MNPPVVEVHRVRWRYHSASGVQAQVGDCFVFGATRALRQAQGTPLAAQGTPLAAQGTLHAAQSQSFVA
jgi:hypothetical protein